MTAKLKINDDIIVYDYVDLGLPSGLLWATCNVGASQPHEYGKYFQWGATEGYYSGTTEALNHSYWDTCPWGQSAPPMGQLDAAHDAARVNMGSKWRMPTSEDFSELATYTSWGQSRMSGVFGMIFVSNSNLNNTIFIPGAGRYEYWSSYGVGDIGCVWSSSFSGQYPTSSFGLYFDFSSDADPQHPYSRYNGMPVRGVIEP